MPAELGNCFEIRDLNVGFVLCAAGSSGVFRLRIIRGLWNVVLGMIFSSDVLDLEYSPDNTYFGYHIFFCV